MICKVLRNLLKSLVIFVITVTLLEITLRVFKFTPIHKNPISGFHIAHKNMGWIGEPNYNGIFSTSGFSVNVSHDSQGFRTQQNKGTLLESEHRIAFFGDSFTWGWGVNDEDVFTNVLSEISNNLTYIRNFGVNGFGTGQQKIAIESFIEDYAPTDIVIMFYKNDLKDNVDPKNNERPWFQLINDQLVEMNNPVSNNIIGPLKSFLRHSVAYTTVKHNVYIFLDQLKEPKNKVSMLERDNQLDEDHQYEIFKRILKNIYEYVQYKIVECEITLVYIPSREDIIDFGDKNKQIVIATKVKAICSQLNINYLDLTPHIFNSWKTGDHLPDVTPYYLKNDNHWDAEGHKIAADSIRKTLNIKTK